MSTGGLLLALIIMGFLLVAVLTAVTVIALANWGTAWADDRMRYNGDTPSGEGPRRDEGMT